MILFETGTVQLKDIKQATVLGFLFLMILNIILAYFLVNRIQKESKKIRKELSK